MRISGFFLAMLLMGASIAHAQIMDPPAADSSPTAFFEKAAQYRPYNPPLANNAGRTLEKAAKFLMSDVGIDANAIRDENGKKVPPYIYHAVIDDNNRFGYRISYPAFHHAYLIEAFLDYYNYSGDHRAVDRAIQLADWTIDHSTPVDWKWGSLPWSTFAEGKPGGLEDKDNIQPDKVGYMGLSYTRLYEVTGNKGYFNAAKRAADTIVSKQGYDGSWPFRVNPKTGEVFQQYTAALFMNVAFLEKMYLLTKEKPYKNSQIIAWMWMMRNPLRTNNWSGLYEDIPKGSDSQVHYSPLQVIRLLLRYSSPVNRSSYLAHARRLFDYTMDGLAFDDRDFGLLLREQTAYPAATPSSTLNWSMMAAEFFLATGDEKFRSTTMQAVKMVTMYGLKPDGRSNNTVLGEKIYGNYGSWYSLTSPVVRYLYQDMGCLPELAPNGETHLLRTSTQVNEIEYGPKELRYLTLPNSVELIKVASAPTYVYSDRGLRLKGETTLSTSNSFVYNARSHVLIIRHSGRAIRVGFRSPK